jgi:cobyrinic acid a,c-diamide synthase
MSRIVISAAHKSSGKTTVSIGLCAALRGMGRRVQPFKKGPDYIDPLWLGEAAGRPCYNLDFYTMSEAEIIRDVARRGRDADVCLIEGNKGLHDGLDLHGSNSNAALAKLLQTPVILVLDTRGTIRGVAPLLLGYQHFDPAVRIAGVILNQTGGTRHESKLRGVIEHYTQIPILGMVRRDDRLIIDERHLGLMPSNESTEAQAQIARIAEIIAGQVDLDGIFKLAGEAPPLPLPEFAEGGGGVFPSIASGNGLALPELVEGRAKSRVKIGILRDAAFGFYYPGDLEAMQQAGAELCFIDALHDRRLPAVDGLFIGGGFPEMRLRELEANAELRGQIHQAVEAELPVYAECGGLMYLSRRMTWNGQSGEMVGALPLDTVMNARPQGRGYVRMRETGAGLWPLLDAAGQPAEFAAHEFHYSHAENLQLTPRHRFAYEVLRGSGIDGQHDGLVYKNTLACYVHLRDVESNHWTRRFVEFARRLKSAKP